MVRNNFHVKYVTNNLLKSLPKILILDRNTKSKTMNVSYAKKYILPKQAYKDTRILFIYQRGERNFNVANVKNLTTI